MFGDGFRFIVLSKKGKLVVLLGCLGVDPLKVLDNILQNSRKGDQRVIENLCRQTGVRGLRDEAELIGDML